MTKEGLLEILSLLDRAGIRYWIEGEWGVDALAGEQTREHADLDIDLDATQAHQAVSLLRANGFTTLHDMLPVRMELRHPSLGDIDIHPIMVGCDGSARQADGEGGFYEFKPEYFGETIFEGRRIRCITLEAQLLFHTGYEPQAKDLFDLLTLRRLAEGACRP